MSGHSLQPEFIDGGKGRIFVLTRHGGEASDAVLIVPPFAEEMNKCRRQLALLSEQLAASGVATVLPDLYGTGDSGGEFRDASFDVWREDLEACIAHAQSRGLTIRHAVAVRFGCLLLLDMLERTQQSIDSCVFWQPVLKGSRYLKQFLRLRVAASMMQSGSAETVEGLRAALASAPLEVAGYELSGELADSIEAAELAVWPEATVERLLVAEISTRAESGVSVAAKRAIAAATDQGVDAESVCVAGEPFWTSTEIVTNADLNELTSNWLVNRSSTGPSTRLCSPATTMTCLA